MSGPDTAVTAARAAHKHALVKLRIVAQETISNKEQQIVRMVRDRDVATQVINDATHSIAYHTEILEIYDRELARLEALP